MTTVRTMCPMGCHPTLCGMLVDMHGGDVDVVKGVEGMESMDGVEAVEPAEAGA